MNRRLCTVAMVAALTGLAGNAAAGDEAPCTRFANGLIEVDGFLDDWPRVRKGNAGGKDADASFDILCGYDAAMLYMEIEVREDVVRRTKTRSDRLQIRLWARNGAKIRVLESLPGVGKYKPKRSYSGSVPAWMKVEDSLRPRGWALEVAIPLRKIAGYGGGAPAVFVRISYFDTDGPTGDRTVEFKGKIVLSGGKQVFKAFLNAAQLSPGDIRLDKQIDVDGDGDAERVIAGGKVIAVLADSYGFFSLPVKRAADVKKVRVVNLAGSKRMAIIAQYRQHGNGGVREVVGVWYWNGGSKFQRVLAFEVRKQRGTNVLENKWYLAKKGKYRGKKVRRGYDIVVEAIEAVGWDEDNYFERPAADVNPILLPWEDETSRVYYFQGDAVFAGGAKRAR